jgi:hypothetical protein
MVYFHRLVPGIPKIWYKTLYILYVFRHKTLRRGRSTQHKIALSVLYQDYRNPGTRQYRTTIAMAQTDCLEPIGDRSHLVQDRRQLPNLAHLVLTSSTWHKTGNINRPSLALGNQTLAHLLNQQKIKLVSGISTDHSHRLVKPFDRFPPIVLGWTRHMPQIHYFRDLAGRLGITPSIFTDI